MQVEPHFGQAVVDAEEAVACWPEFARPHAGVPLRRQHPFRFGPDEGPLHLQHLAPEAEGAIDGAGVADAPDVSETRFGFGVCRCLTASVPVPGVVDHWIHGDLNRAVREERMPMPPGVEAARFGWEGPHGVEGEQALVGRGDQRVHPGAALKAVGDDDLTGRIPRHQDRGDGQEGDAEEGPATGHLARAESGLRRYSS